MGPVRYIRLQPLQRQAERPRRRTVRDLIMSALAGVLAYAITLAVLAWL